MHAEGLGLTRERTERQETLLDALREQGRPMTGAELANLFHVTRQVVVHDIALLRASGVPIHSTPRGYWLDQDSLPTERYVLSVNHPPELTQVELYILVDHGITILDVFVEHPIYGELRGSLHLSSRRDVDLFLDSVRKSKAPLLSSLTEGSHIHTVECSQIHRLTEAIEQLRHAGIEVAEL